MKQYAHSLIFSDVLLGEKLDNIRLALVGCYTIYLFGMITGRQCLSLKLYN